ncbi:MAG: hypothetical protein ACRD00_06070 [Thermoanaerobaculia bacterium]
MRLSLARLAFLFALALALSFAFWVRMPFLRDGLWRDEALSVSVAESATISEIIHLNRVVDYNPPLFNLLLAGWGRLAGFGEASLEAFRVAIGMLALVAVSLLAWEAFGPAAALLAVVLDFNHPLLHQMAGELRPYSLSVLLASASLALVLRLRRRTQTSRPTGAMTVFLGFLLLLLAYSHIGGALIVAYLGLWGIVAAGRGSGFGRLLALAAAAAGVVFTAWLPAAWSQFRVGLPYENPAPLDVRIHRLAETIGSFTALRKPVAVAAGIAAAAALLFAAILVLRPWLQGLKDQAPPFVILTGAMLAVLVVFSLFSSEPRYRTLPSMLLGVLIAGLVASLLRAASAGGASRALAAAGASLLAVSGFLERVPEYARQRRDAGVVSKSGVRDLCRTAGIVRNGDLLLVAPDYLASTARYYCGPSTVIRGYVRWENPEIFDLRGWSELWRSPDSLRETLSTLEKALAADGRSEFLFVWDEQAVGPPLFLRRHSRDLRDRLALQYEEISTRLDTGRRESVRSSRFRVLGAQELTGPVPGRYNRLP